MSQRDLDAAVAMATGEDITEIRRRGFSLTEPNEDLFDLEPDCLPPQVIDWDDVQLRRNVAVVEQPRGDLPRFA